MSKSEQRKYLAQLKARVVELETEQKANRVLSAKNEQDLKDAVDAHKTGIAKQQGVLLQVQAEPMGQSEDDKELVEMDLQDLLDAINEEP